SLIAIIGFFGMVIGFPAFAYFSKKYPTEHMDSGTRIFRCFAPSDIDLLISFFTLILVGLIANLSLFGEITMVAVNYPVILISFFAKGFTSLPVAVISQLMIIDLYLVRHRSSAISKRRFTEAIVRIPAAQLIGLLSDFLRGQESSTTARFYALRN
ncbi:hypothetical protein PFISCL1PPCAC_22206, partial [Pristionchus fissidentatus]